MHQSSDDKHDPLSRRGFLQTVGVGAAGISLAAGVAQASSRIPSPPAVPVRSKSRPSVRVAFLYPPTSTLVEAGYYSWPGSGFDAEGRQRQYIEQLRGLGDAVGVNLDIAEQALDAEASVNAYIEETRAKAPDGLLLILFKKGHWPMVKRVIEETKLPAIVVAPLGVLLVDHISELHEKQGVYLVNALDNVDAIGTGLRMMRVARWMRDSRLIDLAPGEPKETAIPFWGTQLRNVPLERFYEAFARTEASPDVQKLASSYSGHAKDVVEPTKEDIMESAKCYFALKEILAAEEADALMMTCLPGLQKPHRHVPPCMGFMSLRDEGIPAGCQSDLNATLTLMLGEYLFDRPGFQQNASMDTERNLYFGAHCTSPTYMNGREGRREPYILRSHAEAGWGCVPRVLFKEGQRCTMAQYLSGKSPEMIVYTGDIVSCPETPPCGGCRTNLLVRFDGVEDSCSVKGMHQAIFYGDFGKPLRDFCRLYGIALAS